MEIIFLESFILRIIKSIKKVKRKKNGSELEVARKYRVR
jgi:hypothetical protein